MKEETADRFSVEFEGQVAHEMLDAIEVIATYGSEDMMALLKAIRSAVAETKDEKTYNAFQAMGTVVICNMIAFQRKANGYDDEESDADHAGR